VQSAIHKILRKNYIILEELFTHMPFDQHQITSTKIKLASKGFNFEYCTRVYQNNRGKWYRYVYEYSWMEFSNQKVIIYRQKDW